jgi:(1->4)-alpha-D-glucan 1-alpha-D-glucosylmutase
MAESNSPKQAAPHREAVAPIATYRLQLRPGFGFDHAAALCDYLEQLGISHAYFSPYLQAGPGSTHGYDVIDYSRVNDELGGAEAHERLCTALDEHGLGQVIDVVPNHMSITSRDNKWWWDVLENGQASPYAPYFDVDWKAPNELQRNKVLMPILGDHYGRVIEAGEVQIAREGASFFVRVHERLLPVTPPSLERVLGRAASLCGSDELGFFADALRALGTAINTDRESRLRRHRHKQVIGRMLVRLLQEEPRVAHAVDRALGELNADVDQLDALLERQNYRLAYWRTARHDLDYRRFFDINELAALRIGAERVFRDSHALVLQWLQDGLVDGIRVDHPDGMRDPEKYFRRLRAAAGPAWIVVEKILEPGEKLPSQWPIDGTTGYDFMYFATQVFVSPESEEAMSRVYQELAEDQTDDFHKLARTMKRQMLEDLLGADLYRLSRAFHGVCTLHRRHRDFTLQDLREALREVLACLPVYRTYSRPGQHASAVDEQHIADAIRQAKIDRPHLDVELLSFMRELLTGRIEGETEWDLVARFQQLSGPAMAKGVEDTALYRYHRLVCLNEVGSDPARFGIDVDEFHEFCGEVQKRRPRTMLATSTHDTKRSEDVRVRIALLSQIPEEWEAAVRRWYEMAGDHHIDGWPDPHIEYLFWQTMVGTWPITAERLSAYLRKAARESKLYTTWTRVNEEYETALEFFTRRVLQDERLMTDFEAFVARLAPQAREASLAQTLLKLTAPGVPDIYQGNELWDYSLVDPDNRRAVDFELRRRLLEEIATLTPRQIDPHRDDGLPKLWLVGQALRLRARRHECFGPEGAYTPLYVTGAHADRVVAFSRAGQVVSIVPRRYFGFDAGWQDTLVTLPEGRFRNLLAEDQVFEGAASLQELQSAFPVALLESEVAAEEGA